MNRRLARAASIWLALSLVLSTLGPALAHAQEWIVVPYGRPDAGRAQRASEILVRALADRRNSVVSLHEARDRFLERSRLPSELKAADRSAIASGTERALEHAAFGRRDAARKAAEDVLAIAERSMDALHRDSERARNVLDACLAVVRVDLQVKDRRRAVEAAKRCKRLVPDLSPRESTHSAEVIGALAEAENQLRRAGAATLTVEVEGQLGCAVFVNGRRLGTAPFRLDGAAPGETRIEVECAATSSRVHVLELGERAQTLRIDPGHDARVRDATQLALSYASDSDERAHLASDAAAVGALVGARQVVLAFEAAKGAVRLVRYDLPRARAVASAELPAAALDNPREAAWADACEALMLERESVPLPPAFTPAVASVAAEPARPAEATALAPTATAADGEEPAPQPGPRESGEQPSAPSPSPAGAHSSRRGVLITGGVLSGVGAIVLATGYGLYARSRTLRSRAEALPVDDPEQKIAQQKYDDFKNLPLIGLGGSVLLSTAVPMLLPKHGPRSVIAWVGGALAGIAGAGLIAYGASQAGADNAVLTTLLMSSGAPLIEIPITQMVRAAKGP